MNESALARAALDRLIAQKLPTLTVWREYVTTFHRMLFEDIYACPDVYAPHVERAAAFHPDIVHLWQRMLADDDPFTQETPAADMLFCLMLAIFEPRKPPELDELHERGNRELSEHPDIHRYLFRRKSQRPELTQAEIDHVPRQYGASGHYAGHDPVTIAIAHRVYPTKNIIPMTWEEYRDTVIYKDTARFWDNLGRHWEQK